MTVRTVVGVGLFGVVVSALGAGCSAAPGSEETASTSEALPRCKITGDCIVPDPTDPTDPPPKIKQPPPPPPPPPTPVSCSFMDHGGDGIAKAAAEGGAYQNPGYFSGGPQVYHNDVQYPYASTGNCINEAVDALTTAERQLMGYGCSFPFYWEGWDDSSGANPLNNPPLTDCKTNERWGCFAVEANAIVMLCPMTTEITNYATGSSGLKSSCSDGVGGLGCMTYKGQVSDLRTHWAVNGNVATHETNPPGKFFDTLIPSPPNGYGWLALWEDPRACSASSCMCEM